MKRRRAGARPLALRPALIVSFCLGALSAHAQEFKRAKDVRVYWNASQQELKMDARFERAVDQSIQGKMQKGLPTRILLTAVVYSAGTKPRPLATTFQSCKVTWHIWEEMYRVELLTPAFPQPARHWSPTLRGVVRRCARSQGLLLANSHQVSPGVSVFVQATVRVNPLSTELLNKLRRWRSRPSPSVGLTPGTALFSTFTGLFMNQVGDAERTLRFSTRPGLPTLSVAKPAPSSG